MDPIAHLVSLTSCTPAEALAEWSERAAILEHLAHLPRAEAERLAVEDALPFLTELAKGRP